jgi:hypothetical protein
VTATREEAYERWFDAHVTELERDLKPGARVWRAGHLNIEEGEVTRVAKGSWRDNGDFLEGVKIGPGDRYLGREQDGTASYFWARFGREHVGQGHEWRWFRDRRAALADLVRKLESRADEQRRDLKETERLLAARAAELESDRPAAGAAALAIRLATSDPEGLRYFKGGWFSVPAALGAQLSPAVGGAAVREAVVKTCVEAGWLTRVGSVAGDLAGGMAALYATRWTPTDSGRRAAGLTSKTDDASAEEARPNS